MTNDELYEQSNSNNKGSISMVTRTESIKNSVIHFIDEMRKGYRVHAAYIYGSH